MSTQLYEFQVLQNRKKKKKKFECVFLTRPMVLITLISAVYVCVCIYHSLFD